LGSVHTPFKNLESSKEVTVTLPKNSSEVEMGAGHVSGDDEIEI